MLSMPKRDWLLLRARLRMVASLTALPWVAVTVFPGGPDVNDDLEGSSRSSQDGRAPFPPSPPRA
jgi:hypothetical protein